MRVCVCACVRAGWVTWLPMKSENPVDRRGGRIDERDAVLVRVADDEEKRIEVKGWKSMSKEMGGRR